MAACGGSCGGGATADKTAAPPDAPGAATKEGVAYGCKCVCICGTKTEDAKPLPPKSAIPPDEPEAPPESGGGTPTPPDEGKRPQGAAPPPKPPAPPPPESGGGTPTPPDGPGGTEIDINTYEPPVPPLTFDEAYDPDRERPRQGSSGHTWAAADRQRSAPTRVVSAADPAPPPPPLTYLWASSSVVAAPRRVLDVPGAAPEEVSALRSSSPGGFAQGMSGAATAVLDAPPAVFSDGPGISPPDATRTPSAVFPRRQALAPPHAGSFTLGGPDAGPGSGVGARAHPVPGPDGHRRWRPRDDAAKRAEASDLDAHREPLPVRMPFGGIEGDLGPGLEPVPRGVATPGGLLLLRGVAAPPLHPEAPAVPWSPARGKRIALGPEPEAAAPSGVVGGGTAAAASLLGPAISPAVMTAPSGPWAPGTAAASPPRVPGFEATAVLEPPPFPPMEAPAETPAESPDPYAATGRPVQEGLDALKAAMKGPVPVDQWRPPKPEMPGSPTGQRGRGPGLGSLAGLHAEFERAAARRDRAQEEYFAAREALRQGGGDDLDLKRKASYAQYEYELAKADVAEIGEEMWPQAGGAGSQWLVRAGEQYERDQRAQTAENRRRWKKHDTRPNHWAWEQGDIAEKRARGIRDDVRNMGSRIDEVRKELALEGKKLDPASAAEIGRLADKLKALGKELKKKGSAAKGHSKGSEGDAAAAVSDLEDTRKEIADIERAIDDQIANALGRTSPAGPGCPGGGSCGAPGGGGPSPEGAVPPGDAAARVEYTIKDAVWPDCGKKANVCKPPGTTCSVPDTEWTCWTERGDPLPGGRGGKGKGMDEPDLPPGGGVFGLGPAGFVGTLVGLGARTVYPGDGPRPDPGAASPDSPPGPESAPATPPDAAPPVSTEDEEFVRQMARDRLALVRRAGRIGDRIDRLQLQADHYYRRLAEGRELKPREAKRFAAILRDLEVERLAWSFVTGLAGRQETGTGLALLAGGSFREDMRRVSAGFVEASERARELVEEALEAQEGLLAAQAQARVVARRGYTDRNLQDAQALLDLAWYSPPSDSSSDDVADYLETRVEPAREAIRELGLEADSTGAVEIARRLFDRRKNAEMVAADEATGLGSVAWRVTVEAFSSVAEPAGRALQATEKLVEAAVTGVQTLSSVAIAGHARLLKSVGMDLPFFAPEAFERLSARQGQAFLESGGDAWRLLSKQDLEKVRNRITDATLGGATLHRTPEEHQYGSDPLLDFARAFTHFNTAALQVSGGALLGGGAAAGAKALLSRVPALAMVRSAGSAMASRIADAARAFPRTAEGWVQAAKARVGAAVHGGGGFPTRIRNGVLQVLKPSKGGAGPNRWHNVVEEAAEGLTMQERASRIAAGVLRGPSELAESVRGILPLSPRRLTPLHRLSRFLATATQDYDRATPILRLLKKLPGKLGDWEQSHLAIQAQWFRGGSKFALFPEGSRAIVGLRALGQAGFNLAPLPTFINQGLKNSPWLMSAFGLTIQGGTAYGAYRTGRYVYEGVSDLLRDDWSEQPDGR